VHEPRPIQLADFSSDGDPLAALDHRRDSDQVRYLRCYLHDLGAQTVVIEPNYFDRDYLSEFSAFYATTSAGYPNVCRRAHYFDHVISRQSFEAAVGGDGAMLEMLQSAYLGHVVLRPIPGAPVGRTVLRSYPDDKGIAAGTPRVMECARNYEVHVAGVTLRINGLAWQQQDSAVGACATVALWSMLHSSAFDDHHAIPTTAKITSTAHGAVPLGARVFPADSGLKTEQILEVIKGHDLAPVMVRGDLERDQFSRQRFCPLVASYLRSGYPVLVSGWPENDDAEQHTICLVGFRSPKPARVADGEWISPTRMSIPCMFTMTTSGQTLGSGFKSKSRRTRSCWSLNRRGHTAVTGRRQIRPTAISRSDRRRSSWPCITSCAPTHSSSSVLP
jgi:hypothetical protein